MTKEQLSERLNGREYGDEMTNDEEREAKESGLIVIFGASDNLTEFRGAIKDELGAIDGATHLLQRDKVLEPHEECECPYCNYSQVVKNARKVEALWCPGGYYSWQFKTDLPHASFEVIEDGSPYCRGIVIDRNDICPF